MNNFKIYADFFGYFDENTYFCRQNYKQLKRLLPIETDFTQPIWLKYEYTDHDVRRGVGIMLH